MQITIIPVQNKVFGRGKKGNTVNDANVLNLSSCLEFHRLTLWLEIRPWYRSAIKWANFDHSFNDRKWYVTWCFKKGYWYFGFNLGSINPNRIWLITKVYSSVCVLSVYLCVCMHSSLSVCVCVQMCILISVSILAHLSDEIKYFAFSFSISIQRQRQFNIIWNR